MAILDIDAIRDILPHRYPFLLVDRIIELEEERIVGIKNVTANEPFFIGHFPEFEMTMVSRKATICKMTGKATVDGVVVAEATLMCVLRDKPAA